MWEWIIGILISLAIGIYGFYKYQTGNKDYWPKRNIFYFDTSKVAPFWDRITFKIPFHELENLMYKGFTNAGVRSIGGIMEFRNPSLVAIDLDLIKAITVKDFDHFVNRRVFDMSKSDPLFHDMLINKQNQEWKDLRSTLSPTFTTGKIKRMFEVFNQSGDKLATFLDQESAKIGDSKDGIDMRDAVTRYTMDVIASAAFGIESQIFNDKNSQFATWGKRLQNQFAGWKFIKLFVAMFIPKLFQLLRISITDSEAIGFFAGVIQETIKRREKSGEVRDDFIQLLIEAKMGTLKPDNEVGDKIDTYEKDAQLTKASKMPLTDHLILSQALLFFSAGFDTTETLLTFAIYEMALNQEIQEKLFQEIDEAMVNNEGKLSYEVVNRMEYLDKVISETLRKYPPALRTERKCERDYPIKLPNSEYVVKKDQVVIIPMYGIHLDEKYYPEPQRFDPERFSPESKAARHPYAYMPFGTGPRNCIAMRFALIEGKAALAHLVHRFRIEPSEKTNIPVKFGRVIGFKPDDMFLKITRRT